MALDSNSLRQPVEPEKPQSEALHEPQVEPAAPDEASAAVAEKPARKSKPRRKPAAKGRVKEPSVYVATTSGVAEYKGETAVYVKDVTRVAAGHWLLRRCKDAFKPAEEILHYGGDEHATSEKRGK